MRAVIAGCGAVGRNLAEILVREGNSVTVIDIAKERLDSVEEYLDIAVAEGQCTDLRVLRNAGVSGSDIFVAATDDDEANIVAAVTAKRLGAAKSAARCRNQIYSSGIDGKGISDILDIDLVVNPENLTALEIARLIKTPGSLVVENMARGKVHLREIVVGKGSKAAGKTLQDLSLGQIGLVAAISRGGRIIIPKGNTEILHEDRLFIIGKRENLSKLSSVFGESRSPGRKVIILGGGKVGLAAAKLLEKEHLNVILIEKDRRRAEFVSESLKRTLILVGDGTDINLLKEKDIANTDAFIALSGEDENNIISGLLAKELGVAASLVMVERPEYVSIIERLGIDHAVSPRLLTVTEMLHFLRRGNFTSIAVLERESAEIIEVKVEELSNISGKKLKEAGIPSGTIVGSIVRGDNVIVPTGSDTILSGDSLIVFTVPENLKRLENLMV